MGDKARRALRPDAQACDEIRIYTVPRYKTSGLSGDEWRISAVTEFYRKGRSSCGTPMGLEILNGDGGWFDLDCRQCGLVGSVSIRPKPVKLRDTRAALKGHGGT